MFERWTLFNYPNLDPPMEWFEPVWRRGRVRKIASFEGPMILRVSKNNLKWFVTYETISSLRLLNSKSSQKHNFSYPNRICLICLYVLRNGFPLQFYNLGMGLRPSILLFREGSGFLGIRHNWAASEQWMTIFITRWRANEQQGAVEHQPQN